MGISTYITPGDKIDICFLHQNNGKTYKSGVFDILSENEIEMSMPTDGGKMVMFNIGFECQLYFYTSKGLYTCEAVVSNRYKRDQFILMSVNRLKLQRKSSKKLQIRSILTVKNWLVQRI